MPETYIRYEIYSKNVFWNSQFLKINKIEFVFKGGNESRIWSIFYFANSKALNLLKF